MNPRLLASRILQQVIFQGKSLNSCVPQFTQHIDEPQNRAMSRQMVSGALRFYERLDFILSELLQKPMREKDSDVYCLLLIGLYQVFYMRVPDHAAVSETVKLTQKLKKSWARGFVNGVLRQSLRDKEALIGSIENDEEAKYSHPVWLIEKIKTDWPEDFDAIFEQNLMHAPMILRSNQQVQSSAEYVKRLAEREMGGECLAFSKDAIQLEKSCDVLKLPGFKQGHVSVQDQAAQLAAGLLNLEAEFKVLDACSAPGGKTAHMLETNPEIEVLALDVSEDRLARVDETLTRLNFIADAKGNKKGKNKLSDKNSVRTQAADAQDVAAWWDGELFDRILLDAPCSAIGVIRRNPDIKTHRNLEDIAPLVENQRKLLNELWQTLKPGGILLYATCSVLKDENENQIENFMATHSDASELKIEADWGRDAKFGKQILPGENGMDGFYYARILKSS